MSLVAHPTDSTILVLVGIIITILFTMLPLSLPLSLSLPLPPHLKENFRQKKHRLQQNMNSQRTYLNNRLCYTQNQGVWNLPGVNQGYLPEDQHTNNQKLANEKGKRRDIPVIIAPRSHDLDYWKATPFTEHSHINTDTRSFDQLSSGYLYQTPQAELADLAEQAEQAEQAGPAGPAGPAGQRRNRPPIKEAYTPPPTKAAAVSTLPGRYTTSIIHPPLDDSSTSGGIYSSSDVIEPLSVGYHIGSTTTFGPRTTKLDKDGHLVYHESNPNTAAAVEAARKAAAAPIHSPLTDSFDPRFYGYGPPDRGRIDANSGDIRFDYSDIDRLKQPQNPARTNIDHLLSQKHGIGNYGAMPSAITGPHHNQLHAYVDNAFHESQLGFRADLTERLMRKSRAREWQQRAAPIHPFRR
jgi:hypothetical protein